MNKEARTVLEAANTHYREGRFAKAEQAYLQLHALDREHAGILMRLGEIALWKNQPAIAEDYFTTGLDNKSWLAKKWPFSLQLYSSLAFTHYRQNRFSKAAACFRKAAGPVAVGPFHDLKAIGDQLALFEAHAPYHIEGPETVEVPFVLTDPLPVIEVSVNGSEAVPFFIDTGGAEVILDTEFAEQVGAQYAGELHGEGGGTKGFVGLGKVDALSIAGITVKHVPIHTMNTQPFAAVFDDLAVKGVIGTRLLMQFLVTIDYVNGRLILRHGASRERIEAHNARIIPFWLIQTHYIVALAQLNGAAPSLFYVDTGLAGTGFSASKKTLRQAGIVADWAHTEQGTAIFGDTETAQVVADQLTLGTGQDAVMVQHVPGVVFKKPQAILDYKLGFYVGGVVSHQFFRDYALTLDFLAMRLMLHR